MEHITKEQLDQLNQLHVQMHPFTCKNQGDPIHIKYEFEKCHKGESYEEYLNAEREKGIKYPEMEFNETVLIRTEAGLVCPVCDYTQRWGF